MKKIVSALLIAMMLFTSLPAALAAEGAVLSVGENNINTARVVLKLTTDGTKVGKSTTLRVYAENAQENIANMLWADENEIGADGTCSFTVDMSNYDTGKYVFVSTISGVNEAFRTDALQIYGSQEKTDLLNKMVTAKANENISEVKWIAENRWEYLSLDKSGYDLIPTTVISDTATETYLDVFCKNVLKTEFKTLDDFAEKFNKTVSIAKLYTATNVKATADELLKTFELTKSKAYTDYSDEDEPAIALTVASSLAKDCLSLTADNFAEKFNFAVVQKLLSDNLGAWSGYQNVLSHYAAEIGIDMTTYDDLTNQSAVINAMIVNHDHYASFKDIASDFEELTEAQKKAEEKTSSSDKKGSSSSQSSGRFSGGGVVKPSQPQTPANVEKSLFKDIETVPWAKEAIDCLAERGIINGRGDETFAPDDSITRAETVKLLVTAFNLTAEKNESVFSDVKPEDWFGSYVAAAYYGGIVNGLTQDTFGPNEPVTRQDLCVMIARLIKNDSSVLSDLSFDDNAEVSGYAKDAVALLVKQGIINGIGGNRFAPNEKATRAQTAKIVYEMIKTGV